MLKVHQNQVAEWRAPQGQVTVTAPDGTNYSLRTFQKGDGAWYVRYASAQTGTHTYRAGGESGQIEVTQYTGENPLYLHGPVRQANKKYLEHQDGTPFFWLADTWWMGFTTRLPYPDSFAELTNDRVEKGFSVVQIIAGLYPDMDPFDPRGMNEAGYPWNKDFTEVNPAYFDAADKKIQHLIENGIMPCIVGCWGYFMDFAGYDAIRRHWDYLIDRWSAYPVVWCLAGEALMAFYNNMDIREKRITYEEYATKLRAEWTKMTAHVKETDPFRRLITIHPTQNGHEQVDDDSLLNLDMLQTGHDSFLSLLPTIKQVKAAVDRGVMPVINSEVCYEGICGSSFEDVQRYLFLSCVLTGCCGHTYGATGIWQFNTKEKPYGPSPHGASWGEISWEDAYKLSGSRQVGHLKRFLTRFDWWRMERHPEWVSNPCDYETLKGMFCAGIPGELRIAYRSIFGGTIFGRQTFLELDGTYHAYYYNMIQDKITDLGMASPDENGKWNFPGAGILQDWVMVLSKNPIDFEK